MELPVLIEPLPNHRGFTARLAAPFDLTAEASTVEEAHRQLSAMLEQRLRQGLELRTLSVPVAAASTPAGWLPDDELTHEWLDHIQEYREECDVADRARFGVGPRLGDAAS